MFGRYSHACNLFELVTFMLMPWYCILSIQTWIFGLKYVKSVIHSAPSNLCCSIKCVIFIEWIFISVYFAIVIWFGYNLELDLSVPHYKTLYKTWIAWIVFSTLVTFYGIFKLIKAVKELKSKNPFLKFNSY